MRRKASENARAGYNVLAGMDRPLREHIQNLERRIRLLSQQIMDNHRTREDRNRIESELRAAEMALSYYRKAVELEQQVLNT